MPISMVIRWQYTSLFLMKLKEKQEISSQQIRMSLHHLHDSRLLLTHRIWFMVSTILLMILSMPVYLRDIIDHWMLSDRHMILRLSLSKIQFLSLSMDNISRRLSEEFSSTLFSLSELLSSTTSSTRRSSLVYSIRCSTIMGKKKQ